MGSNARLRGLLTQPVHCQAYYNNGDTVNSNYCITKRTNPNLVVGPFGRAILSAVAGLSALECILFLVTLILTFLFVRRQPTTTNYATKEADMPMQAQPMQPLVPPAQPPYQTQGYQAPAHAPQQHYQSPVQHHYPAPDEHKVSPVQSYAAPASTSPAPQGAYVPPHQPYQTPYQGQQYPELSSTPAPQRYQTPNQGQQYSELSSTPAPQR